jgi:hypothetical protein
MNLAYPRMKSSDAKFSEDLLAVDAAKLKAEP